MDQTKSISKAYVIYFIGTALSRFVGVLLLPLFTRYLSKSDYGYFEIVHSTILLMAPILSFQISQGILRFAITGTEEEKKSIISSASFFLAGLLILLFFIIQFMKGFTEIRYIDVVTAFLYLFIINQFLMNILRTLDKREMYSIGSFLYGLGIAIFSLIFFFADEINLKYVLLSYVFSNLLVVIILWIKISFHDYLSWRNSDFKKFLMILKYSLPLLFDAVCWWIMNLSDRFLLKYFLDLEAVGIYAVAYKFSATLLFANVVFYMVWQEESIKNAGAKGQSDKNASIFNRFMKIQLSVYLMIIPLTKIYMDNFIDMSYYSALEYAPILIGSAAFSSFAAFYGMQYQVQKRTNAALVTSLIGSGINVVLNILLIPRFGLWGSTVSTLFSFMLLWIIRLFGSDSFVTMKDVQWNVLIIGIIFCTVFTYFTLMLDTPLLIVVFFLALIATLVFNKELFQQLIKTSGRNA